MWQGEGFRGWAVLRLLEGRVRKQDVFAFLKSTQAPEPFRIIFADPPYEKTKSGGEFTQLLLESPELAGLLEGLANGTSRRAEAA